MFVLSERRGRLFELEALRGFVAAYVVFHHTCKDLVMAIHPSLEILVRFGQEAVVLFFILSGFVIHHTYLSSDGSWTRYAKARFFRIYPIFLAALVVTVACWVFAPNGHSFTVPELVGNLLMLQDRPRDGTIVYPFLGNDPLWSLSYEAIFYLGFPLVVLTIPERHRHRMVIAVSAIGLASVLFMPAQLGRWAAYFVIWWLGVELSKVHRTGHLQRSTIETLVALAVFALVWIAYCVGYRDYSNTHALAEFPILETRHFGAALLIGVALLAWSRVGWIAFRPLFGWFAAVAPISYALYVLHFPIMAQLPSALPAWPPFGTWLLLLSITVGLSFLLERVMQPRLRLVFRRAVLT